MKFIEKISLKIFSLIIGIFSAIMILIILELINVSIINQGIAVLTDGELNVKITLIISAVLLFLSLICFLFSSKKEDASKDGIVLENTSGKLVISKESLENMIASVAKEIPGTESITSKTILDKEKNLKVFVTIVVSRDIMLKDISSQLQAKIKDAMRQTADLEVKEVNIRIKNITSKKVKNANSNNTPVVENNNTDSNKQTQITNEENMMENETGEE